MTGNEKESPPTGSVAEVLRLVTLAAAAGNESLLRDAATALRVVIAQHGIATGQGEPNSVPLPAPTPAAPSWPGWAVAIQRISAGLQRMGAQAGQRKALPSWGLLALAALIVALPLMRGCRGHAGPDVARPTAPSTMGEQKASEPAAVEKK